MWNPRSKLLLYVAPGGVTAAVWHGARGLAALQSFKDEETGHAAFRRCLRQHARLPVLLTMETFEEDYRVQALPRASRRDRRQMIERKLHHFYRSSAFCAASPQRWRGRARSGEHYLFAALTAKHPLQPWLAMLTEARSYVAGVYPMALVLLALMDKLRLPRDSLLLVVRHDGSVRQIFVDGGELRMNRLTRLSKDEAGAARACADEIRNTRAYLEAAKLIASDQALEVALIDADGSLGHPPDDHDHIRYRRIDTATLATCGIRARDAVALTLHLLAWQTPALNLAPAAITASHRQRCSCMRLYRASALTVLFTLLWSLFGSERLDALGEERRALAARLTREEQAYAQRTADGGITAASAARMQGIVEAAAHLRRLPHLPQRAYRAVGQVLERDTRWELTRLEWRNAMPEETSAPTAGPVQSMLLGLRWRAEVEDRVPAAINTFLTQLRSQERVARVTLLRSPASSMQTPETGDDDRTHVAPAFEIEVVLEPDA